MKKTITTTIAAVALLTLAACGSGKANEAVANEARPTVTATVTTEVPTVPAICTTALGDADSVMATAGEGFGILGEAMDAASKFDADGVDGANVKMEALNVRLTAALATYKTSRDACKAGN